MLLLTNIAHVRPVASENKYAHLMQLGYIIWLRINGQVSLDEMRSFLYIFLYPNKFCLGV
jgi:hypothetical protein